MNMTYTKGLLQCTGEVIQITVNKLRFKLLERTPSFAVQKARPMKLVAEAVQLAASSTSDQAGN